jgi:hypothetical protein
MKLGELKSAIRHRKGNPSLFVSLVPGADRIAVTVQKASILEALDAAFPGGRSAETGLRLNDDGLLIGEGAPPISDAVPEVEANDDLDSLDDLDTPAAADDLDELDEL